MEQNELESAVKAAMAKAFIENLPEETRNDILASSVEKTLSELCSAYSMEKAIKDQLSEYVVVYVAEYLKDSDVQARLKQTAHEAVDTIHDAVLSSMMRSMESSMKSEYRDFVKEHKEQSGK